MYGVRLAIRHMTSWKGGKRVGEDGLNITTDRPSTAAQLSTTLLPTTMGDPIEVVDMKPTLNWETERGGERDWIGLDSNPRQTGNPQFPAVPSSK